MERADEHAIAIVGGSAAGLAAAWAAASAGADVVLLESKAQIGEPAAPAIVGFDFLWPAQIPRPKHALRRRLAGLHVRGSDGRGPTVDAPLSLVDRARFDVQLAAEAAKAGARIITGVEGLRVDDARTLRANGLTIRAKTLIFADGAHTLATRFMRPTIDPEGLAWGAILEFDAPGDADQLSLTLGPHAPGGRSQLNPLGHGKWSHWTFFRGDPTAAEAIARRALALEARIMGWDPPAARFMGVAPDPVYRIPRELVRGNIMVAGGAAGQGGLEVGLASGWMAGEVAAASLARGGDLRDYERQWKARYQKGYRRLRRTTDALARLTDAETRRLLGAWDGARLPAEPSARVLTSRPRGALALGWAAFLSWARA